MSNESELLAACQLVLASSIPDGEGGWHTPEKAADAVRAAVDKCETDSAVVERIPDDC